MMIVTATATIWSQVFAQDDILEKHLSVYGGIGSIAIRDEYISLGRYTGPLSTFGVEWGTRHDSVWTHFNLEYQHGAGVANAHSQADVHQVRLFYDHQYFLRRISLFGAHGNWYLGPSGQMAMHIRIQQVAQREVLLSKFVSFFMDNSVGASSSLTLPVAERWTLSAGASVDLISVGLKMIDFTDATAGSTRDPIIKVLTPFTNINGRFDVGVDYTLFDGCALSGRYMFQLIRNTSWDELLTAGDNVMAKVSYDW